MRKLYLAIILALCLLQSASGMMLITGRRPAAAGGGNDIAFANLGTSANPDINSSTDASSYVNSSWSPPSSGLIIACIGNRNVAATTPATPTITGNNLTWIQITTVINPGGVFRLTMFGANLSGSSTGATTVDFGGENQRGATASFFQATGVDLSGGVVAAFIQSPTNTGTGTTTSTVTLSAASDTNNRPVYCSLAGTSSVAQTPRINWAEVDDLSGSDYGSIETQYRDDAFETTASATWTGNGQFAAIAAELKD